MKKPETVFSLGASVVLIAVLFSGCLSPAADTTALHQNPALKSGSVYFAEAPRMATREKELSECLFRVAGQIAMRGEVRVRHTITDMGGGLMRRDTVLDYDQNNSIAILERLTVEQVVQTDHGTAALIRDTARHPSGPRIADGAGRDGRPEWIERPQSDTGFYMVVGMVNQRTNRTDGFKNSDTDALGRLAAQVSNPLTQGTSRVHDVRMRGAWIVRRWYDAETGVYYSLAVLPR